MRKGLYVGSFDPFTLGHLHVLKQACELFDEVIVAICINADKKRRFDIEDMIKAIQETLKEEGLDNTRVIFFDGLSAELAKKEDCTFLIRGLRNGTDFEYEENIAQLNEELNPNIKTIYFRAGKLGFISSSGVMQVYRFGGDIVKWVSKSIYKLIKNK